MTNAYKNKIKAVVRILVPLLPPPPPPFFILVVVVVGMMGGGVSRMSTFDMGVWMQDRDANIPLLKGGVYSIIRIDRGVGLFNFKGNVLQWKCITTFTVHVLICLTMPLIHV